MSQREDDWGLIWQIEAPPIESQRGTQSRVDFHRAPAPSDYKLPEYFSFRDSPQVAIDIETFDPNLETLGPGPRRRAGEGGKITGYAVATPDGRAGYFPIGHDDAPNLDADQTRNWLNSELAHFRGEVVGANILYDFDWMEEYGVAAPRGAKFRDVQWAAPLLDESARSYSLNTLLQRYLGETKATDAMTALYGRDYIKFMHKTHPGHAATYALGDVEPLFRLLAELKKQLEIPEPFYDTRKRKDFILDDGGKLRKLYDIECGLFPMLLRMRRLGTRIDTERVERANDDIAKDIEAQLAKIKHATGVMLSATAPTSEVAMLFDKQGVPYPKSKEGKPSITSKWLEAQAHDLCDDVNTLRQLEKFRGTFIAGYFQGHQVNGRIHAQFHPLRTDDYGTVSGRFSSSGPNLQNIPVRNKKTGPLARSLFVPSDGRQWWSRDYSQIEYRFLVHFAELAKSPGANIAGDAFRFDPHTDFHEIAARITGVDRKKAKNINFGVAYGMGDVLMALSLGVDLATGRQILATFHDEMPFLKDIYKRAINAASNRGYIATILGRRRRFDLWEERTFQKRNKDADEKSALRRDEALATWGEAIRRAFCNKALNAALQGSAADLMKKAMVDAWDAGVFDGTGVDCTLTVHDELNGEHDDTPRAAEALKELDRIMCDAIKLTVPVMAEGKSGRNWHEAKN